MATGKSTYPPAVAKFVYSQADLLQGSGRTLTRWVLAVLAAVTIGLSWAALTFLPGNVLRWGLAVGIVTLGAAAAGILWVRSFRATRTQAPVVIEGRVKRKRRIDNVDAFEFHVQVKKFGTLARTGQTSQVPAQAGETIDSIVSSRELYSVIRKDKPCSLFCLPSGQCLAAFQDDQLIW